MDVLPPPPPPPPLLYSQFSICGDMGRECSTLYNRVPKNCISQLSQIGYKHEDSNSVHSET